jgi:hypothetical protein
MAKCRLLSEFAVYSAKKEHHEVRGSIIMSSIDNAA